MSGAGFIRITPVLHVPDLDQAVAFFCDVLGFTPYVKAGGYAYVQRECAAVRLMDRAIYPDAPAGADRFRCYIDVDDADAVYALLKPKLDALPPGAVQPPCDRVYGQREFAVRGPDGDLIVFGASL